MGLQTWLVLVACNLVWSMNSVMGKVVLAEVVPVQLAAYRYFFAWLAFLLWASGRAAFGVSDGFLFPKTKAVWGGILGMGLGTFCLSPLLQTTGLNASGAIEGALVIAAEPLLIAVMGWLFLRERLGSRDRWGLLLALVGFALLSWAGWDAPATKTADDALLELPRWVGNLALLGAIVGEAACSVIGRALMRHRLSALGVFGTGLTIGVTVLVAIGLLRLGPQVLFGQAFELSWQAWGALVWLGPLGTTVTYVLWNKMLVHAPASIAGMSLFVQPVAGAFFGAVLLGEKIEVSQVFGGGMILLGTLLPHLKRR